MYKIRRVKFKKHIVLGNLELDFCDHSGHPVDTVIIAGENGTGKSILLKELYGFTSYNPKSEADLEIENESGRRTTLSFYSIDGYIHVKDGRGFNEFSGSSLFPKHYQLNAVFSDVDNMFNDRPVTTVTSLEIDQDSNSRKSNVNLAGEINQLLVDLQSLDDSEIAREFLKAKKDGIDTNSIRPKQRMKRFSNAFSNFFNGLGYCRIENYSNRKVILFNKNGNEIPIEDLSSGEKQIIYRGCYLLKDKEALNGAFVYIDEPEISMHPNWQKKILDYYKSIFTNENGVQTSQLFVTTHSPFIIHNDNRKNDKVIVLSRESNGIIKSIEKASYYICNDIEVVKDAFSINDFKSNRPIVFLEGRTDEKYLKKAMEVFQIAPNFDLKWIGHIGKNGQEENSGCSSMDKAYQFLLGHQPSSETVFLYDYDTNKHEEDNGSLHKRLIPYYENSKGMKKGIENALVLDSVDTEIFYREKIENTEYAEKKIIQEFEKMKFCDYICGLQKNKLERVLINLKSVLMEMGGIIKNNHN